MYVCTYVIYVTVYVFYTWHAGRPTRAIKYFWKGRGTGRRIGQKARERHVRNPIWCLPQNQTYPAQGRTAAGIHIP